jgi:S-layer protein (TIGR01567 family)
MNISKILILVLLSTFVLNIGLGTALQSTMTLNNGTVMSYVYEDEIDDGSAINFAASSVNLAGEEYILYSVYSSVPPTIDGSLSLNEWGEPAIVDTLTYTNDSVNYETHDMFVYFMNDNNYLYIAVKITNDDYESDLDGDWDKLEIWFDGNNNGIIEPDEDIKQFTNLLYDDWFYEGELEGYHTWSSDASLDGEGVASHSNQAIGDYTYEFKIPLNSGDAHDLAITSDSTIGLHIKYSEYYYDSIDDSWLCDGTEDGWPNNGDQFNGSNYGTLKLNSSFTQPGYMEELVSITGQQTTPIVWNASNFDGFKYNSSNIQSTETLTIAPFTLHGPNIDRIIEAGNLTYTTSFVLNEYPIYKDLGLYVNNIDEGYSIGYLNGEQYVAINNADKLAKPLVEFDGNDVKTLRTGDVWDIGGGFSITVLQVDTDGNKVWIELDKNGAFLADQILATGSYLQSRVWTYDEDVAGESDIPILSLYVSGIMQGEDTDYVQIKYLSLIDNNVLQISSDDLFGNMEVIFMAGDSLGFSNWMDLNLIPSNSPSMVMENMSFITLDNLSSIEFYPSVVRNEIPTLSGGGGFVSGNYSSLWNLSENYTIALQEVDIEGEKAMFSLLEDGVIVDQKIMTERSIAPSNLDSNYQYIKNGTQIINATLDFVFHGSNSEVANLINVYQWSEVDSSILLSNESHIFKSTTSTGMPWNLSEGYTLTMKDVSLDAHEVWFQLSKNDIVVKDDLLDEDTLNTSIYTSGNGNISYVLDSIFGGANESVVKISNVNQYSDISGKLLINNSTHLYKTGNPDGISWILPDGYLLSMKGIDEGSENVWFELFKDGNSLKEDIVRSNAFFTYVNGLESFNCLVSGVIHGTLTDATKITGVDLYSDAGVQLMHNGSKIYATSNPSGEIWQLSEGYSLDPKDVDIYGDKVWLSLSKDGVVVKDEIIDSWDNDAGKWFNYHNSSGELVFSTYVDQVFHGMVGYVVALENSKQYSEINGTVLLSIPKTVLRAGITLNNGPTVTILSPLTVTNDSTPLLHATFDQTAEYVWYVIDGAAGTGGFNIDHLTVTLPELADGQHRVGVYANNIYGNIGNATQDFLVDTIAPSITINQVTSPTNASSQIIVGTFDESGSGIDSITVNGEFAVITYNNYSADVSLTEGSNTITVVGTDNAGNIGEVEDEIVVDTTAPTVNSVILNNTVVQSGASIEVNVSAIDVNDIVTVTADGVTLTLTGDYYIGIITAGVSPVTVNVTDEAGNMATDDSATYTIDNDAPSVNSIILNDTVVQSGTFIEVNVSATDDHEIINVTADGFVLNLTGDYYIGTIMAETSPVIVSVTDEAGNTATDDSVTYTIDDDAPVVHSITLNDTVVQSGTSIEVNVSATDTHEIVNVTVDGFALNLTGDYYIGMIIAGESPVIVNVTDEAGNMATDDSATYIIDDDKPVVNISDPQQNDSIRFVDNIVKGNVTDANFASAHLIVRNETNVIVGLQYDLIIEEDGSFIEWVEYANDQNNTLELCAFDQAGNFNDICIVNNISVLNNTVYTEVEVEQNIEKTINATDEADTELLINANINTTINVTITAITDVTRLDNLSDSSALRALGNIVEIHVDGINASNASEVNYVTVRMYYTIDDLDLDGDGTIEVGELNEDDLFIYWYDSDNTTWIKLETNNLIWVNSVGWESTGDYSGYVWAKIHHLSTFGLAAGSVPESTDDGDGNDDYVPPSSGGGGGGSGSSGEAYGNIAVKEVIRNYVSVETTNTYQFKGDANAIGFIIFDAKTNAGYIAATVEVLKDTSSLVSVAPSGKVYQNMNIWVGTSGYATENNIANPVIGFKVAKSWITENDIDESTIKLNRYSSGVWDQLPTTKADEDGSYIYFSSETPGFSPFAITGDERSSTAVADTDGPLFSPPSSIADDDVGEPVGETANVPYDEAKSSSGFILVIGLIIISVLGVGVYLRKNKR